MLTLCILALLILVLFAMLLITTGLVVIWPLTLALVLMIVGDVLIIKSIFKRR